MNNLKTTRAERPDKSLFYAMLGVFFLLFAVAPAYWAFYNFGEYDRTSAFVRELKRQSDEFLTPNEREERKNRIASSNSRADRYFLEMILSGAGSLVLFGISLLLLRKALKARKKENHYENVDWRLIPIPQQRLEVRCTKLHDILFALIVLFFGGMLLFIVYQNFTGQFITPGNALIRASLFGVPVILFLAIFCFIMLRAKRRIVVLFDASGITRGDGRHFLWSDFCGVVTQTAFNPRTQKRRVWRIELAFSGGEAAWIIPNRIKNAPEVFEYLQQLPRAVLKTM